MLVLEKEEIFRVVCAKVTGPNGKSIIYPQTGYKNKIRMLQEQRIYGHQSLKVHLIRRKTFAIYVAPKATTKAKLNTVSKAWDSQ